MKKNIFFTTSVLMLSLIFSTQLQAIEKLRIGTAIKEFPGYYLPILAAQEHGFFKQNGLEVEWVPFKGSPLLNSAVAAGDIKMGMDGVTGTLQAVSRGLPLVIIASLYLDNDFNLYVRADSPIRDPKDLRGAKLGTTRLGTISHIYGQFLAKKFGLEKEVKFVGTGGVTEVVAAMKAGVLDGTVLTPSQFAELQLKGEVRLVTKIADHLPKEWVNQIIFSPSEFIKRNSETVRRSVKSLVAAFGYIYGNPGWSIAKIKSESGFSEEASKLVYQAMGLSRDGKISRRALENVINFVVEYGLVPKDKLPAVDQLYTREFTD